MTDHIKHYFEEIGAWPRDFRSLAYSYVAGFVLSLLLTIAAYRVAVDHVLLGSPLILVLLSLACIQFIVQVICFLHLDRAAASRERLIVLGAIIIIVLILVVGSIWVMNHLNARMMADPTQMEQYMQDQQGM